MSEWLMVLMALVFVVFAPLAGCLLAGIDRKLSLIHI